MWDIVGWLADFSYEHIIFLEEFLKEGEISPRQASPPDRASSPPYEQPRNKQMIFFSKFPLFWNTSAWLSLFYLYNAKNHIH